MTNLDADDEILMIAESGLVSEREESDLVESVGGVRDELTQEDLLVLVERVDDELHHAVNLSDELLLLGGVAQLFHLSHTQPVELDLFLLALHHFVVRSATFA